MNVLPYEKVEQILRLLEQGKSLREVAKIAGVNKTTVSYYKHRMHLATVKPHD